METIITIETPYDPKGRFGREIHRLLNEMGVPDGTVYCINVFDQGNEVKESQYVIRCFTESGLCKHSSKKECVKSLFGMNPDLYPILHVNLTTELEKLAVAERVEKEEEKRQEHIALIVKKFFNTAISDNKKKKLDDLITELVITYPEYYKMKLKLKIKN